MVKPLFNPYKDNKQSMLLFPHIKKEINGRKYSYGGEYPFNESLVYKIKKTMNSNGFDVFYQKRPEQKTVIIWWCKK
jgi:hypothetical protein